MEACHYNRNKLDCSLKNLRWDTPKGNKADMLRHGTRLMGEKAPWAKLTEEQIREIFNLRSEKWTHQEIANKLGVSRPTISRILSSCNWKHMKELQIDMKNKIGDWQADIKFKNEDIKEIFRLRKEGKLQREIASIIGISRPYVSQILSGSKRSKTSQETSTSATTPETNGKPKKTTKGKKTARKPKTTVKTAK
jgi:predicted transcriptional regulator